MAGPNTRLGARLRELRMTGLGVKLTQVRLITALSPGKPVRDSNVSGWENGQVPEPKWLEAYARFFATSRSIVGGGQLRLLPVDELTDEERERYEELLAELTMLAEQPDPAGVADSVWKFGPGEDVTIVCARLPKTFAAHEAYSDPTKPDYVELYTFADADALVALYGHIRELNPGAKVHYRTVQDLTNADLVRHLVLLGGVDWNYRTKDVMEQSPLPVRQVGRIPAGIGSFQVDRAGKTEVHVPAFDLADRLERDVALFYRGENPYARVSPRTVTICNGMFGRGTFGVAMALTDDTFRERNQDYVNRRFGKGLPFAILSRIDVGASAPDWSRPEYRLYEWPEREG